MLEEAVEVFIRCVVLANPDTPVPNRATLWGGEGTLVFL